MDEKVNTAIADVIKDWPKGENNKAVARAIYYELGGWYWADKIERWAAKSEDVEKYPQTRYQNVYRGMPIWATRVNYLFGVGRTFRVNDVMVGSDKFGHFFSQGYKYYKRDLKGWDDERVVNRGAYAERWLFGQLTTGVYANADLVANYEGMRFYLSLFKDDIIEGKGAILKWQRGQPVQIRAFSWTDHINDYWDEALNPSFVVSSLDSRLQTKILEMCDDFVQYPEFFVSVQKQKLWQTYQHIGLKDMRVNLIENVCKPRSY
jgi:hypothetical protein